MKTKRTKKKMIFNIFGDEKTFSMSYNDSDQNMTEEEYKKRLEIFHEISNIIAKKIYESKNKCVHRWNEHTKIHAVQREIRWKRSGTIQNASLPVRNRGRVRRKI